MARDLAVQDGYLRKLDGRCNGHDRFTHRVNFDGFKSFQSFLDARVWLWETFGPSCELPWARKENFQGRDLQWAWELSHDLNRTFSGFRIYLKDQALSMYILKWGR